MRSPKYVYLSPIHSDLLDHQLDDVVIWSDSDSSVLFMPHRGLYLDLLSLLVNEAVKPSMVWNLVVQTHTRKFHQALLAIEFRTIQAKPTVQRIADFFVLMQKTNGFLVIVIKGYVL